MRARIVIGGFGLLLAGASGCQQQTRKPPPVALAPSAELIAGQRAFLGGHPVVAIGHFNLFWGEADGARSTRGRTEAHYWLGLCELRLNRPERALMYLDQVLKEEEAAEDLAALALAAAGRAAYHLQAFDRSLGYYGRLTEPLLARVAVDEVVYGKALALRRLGRWDEALSHFRQVAARFPDSPRAAEARREADRPQRYFTCQIGWFGKGQNADRLAKTARRVAFDARVEPGVRKGAPGFAVMVGRYVQFADAQQTVVRLRRAGFDAFVVP